MTGRERTNKKVQEDELGKDENTNVFGRCAAFMSQMLTVNSCCSLEIKTDFPYPSQAVVTQMILGVQTVSILRANVLEYMFSSKKEFNRFSHFSC